MALVITFSGTPGAGKTPCGKYAASELQKKGLPAYYLRFRQLSLKSFFQPKKQILDYRILPEKKPNVNPESIKPKFEAFRPKSVGEFLLQLGGYLWRILLFQLLIRTRYRNDIVVVDRFIYDSLVHFDLDSPLAQKLYRLFLKIIPRPTVSFIVSTDFEELMKTKGNYFARIYDPLYIQQTQRNYGILYGLLQGIHPRVEYIHMNNVQDKMRLVLSKVNGYLNINHNSGG